MDNDPNIVVMGGGTGSFTLLQELKTITPNITAVVNMSDDGGSSGILRDELGVLPPGDVRQCLVALSDTQEVRDLFGHRFSEGNLAGQSLGNLILSGLEREFDSFGKAVKIASEILKITGRVVPVTFDNHVLVLSDGSEVIEGEYLIGHRPIVNRDARLSLRPDATVNPEAQEAVASADLLVFAPGNLFGSLLPILAVDGVPEAIKETEAKVVSVTNLVTKPGQTDDWHVVDYVKEFESYIDEGAVDYVLYNDGPIPRELLEKYAGDGEFPVGIESDRFSEIKAKSIGANLVSSEIVAQDPSDTIIRRTLIRHDAKEVGRQLMELL